MKIKPSDILNEREERAKIIEELCLRFKLPMVVIRVNYPGLYKNNALTEEIIEIMDKLFTELFMNKIHYKLLSFTVDGPVIGLCVEEEALNIKKIAIGVEDKHILGRVVDIDVFDENAYPISRSLFGLPMRKCFLCENPAQECVRSKKHELSEIIDYINKKYKEYLETYDGKKL